MTAPVSPIATQPFWVVERVLYLDGWEKGRPVYVMNGLRPDDHAYSQDIEHAKQFPTKDDAAAYLRDNLRDNEAFEIHEHMMVAPPTATQETPEQMADWIVERCPLPVNDTIGRGWLRKAVADTVKDALSSAERRIEELVRGLASVAEVLDPHWPAKHKPGEAAWMVEEIVALANEATDVTTLKAEVEELKRRPDMLKQLLDDANAAHFDATMRADEAESRLASLTGQVEDMRERAAKVADEWGWSSKPDHAHGIRDAIRSLPVLPTTGDGGEDDADLPDPSEVRGILKPTGRETSGEET